MDSRLSRRTFAAAALAASAKSAFSAEKKPRVLFLLGDYYHNGAMQEYNWRRILEPTGWDMTFAQASNFVTPRLLAKTDLYVLCRYATDTQKVNYSLGWTPEKLVSRRPAPPVFMTPAEEDAIIENVRRGMGLLAVHCTIWNPKNVKFLAMLGVEKPIMHGPVVATQIHTLNQDHPISKGIQPFRIGIDEAFNAVMQEGKYIQLFRSRQETPPREAISGWCREEGKGRVVALLPGHTNGPYEARGFREMLWRSAHWALRKDIPQFPG